MSRCYLWGCQNREVPADLEFLFSIISLTDQPEVIGSFSYPDKHLYPGDIDVFQEFTLAVDSKREAAKIYAEFFKIMARRIDIHNRDDSTEPAMYRSRQIYLTDFKAGMYITENGETDKLRWTLKELSDQVAVRNGKYYDLVDSLMEGTLVKLDLATNFRGRLTSIETIYYLRYSGGDVSSMSDQPYIQTVTQDYLKFSNPNSNDYKPLKAIKRLWIVSILSGNPDLANDLAEIFGSNIAALHQASETISTMLSIMEKTIPHGIKLISSLELLDRQIPTTLLVDNTLWVGRALIIHGHSMFKEFKSMFDQLWRLYDITSGNTDRLILETMVPLLQEIKCVLDKETMKIPDLIVRRTRREAMKMIDRKSRDESDGGMGKVLVPGYESGNTLD